MAVMTYEHLIELMAIPPDEAPAKGTLEAWELACATQNLVDKDGEDWVRANAPRLWWEWEFIR